MSAIFGSLINSLTNTIKSIKSPFPVIPAALLLCDINNRPGLSAIRLGTSIIARLPEIGIHNGPNRDGSENLINRFVMLLSEEIVKEIKENAVSINVVTKGSVKSTGVVMTASGPGVVNVANMDESTSKGIIA